MRSSRCAQSVYVVRVSGNELGRSASNTESTQTGAYVYLETGPLYRIWEAHFLPCSHACLIKRELKRLPLPSNGHTNTIVFILRRSPLGMSDRSGGGEPSRDAAAGEPSAGQDQRSDIFWLTQGVSQLTQLVGVLATRAWRRSPAVPWRAPL